VFKPGALLFSFSQLKQYKLDITALQETRWQGKNIMVMKSHTLNAPQPASHIQKFINTPGDPQTENYEPNGSYINR
jgi:hypothetical protein